MVASLQTGSGSNLQHFRKLRELKSSNKLPQSFQDTFDELEEQYKFVDYIPSPPLTYTWKQYWKIRRTKVYENPVSFTDIHHFEQVTNSKLDHWEVDMMFRWDSEYYHYCQKHKE